MTDIKRVLKYSPSSAAFMYGDIVMTKDSSGCLRKILFSSHGLREEIDPIYQEVGKAHEEWVESRLTGYRREESLRGPISGNDLVQYSGRMDFISDTDVIECKATVSKRTRLEVIRKGNVKINHLAQIVSYLIQLERTNAKLIVGFYEQDNGKFVCTEHREFNVTIDDNGRILVDGTFSGYGAIDQLRHMQRAAKHLAEGTLGPRPQDWDAKYTSPCNYCPFKAACDKVDSGNTTDPVALAKEAIDEHKLKPKKPVEITQFKPKKEKKL
jgi:CRISPR/Cas system-associated exonuclease Cas4 (RecB family)